MGISATAIAEIETEGNQKPSASDLDIRLAPIALLVKWYGLEVAYRITENLDFGINGVIYGDQITDRSTGSSLGMPVNDGYSVGLNANYYFNRLPGEKSEFYVGAKLIYDDYKDVHHQKLPIYDNKGISFICLVGIKHNTKILSGRFSLLLGAGLQYDFYEDKELPSFYSPNPQKESSRKLGFYPEFKVAYRF